MEKPITVKEVEDGIPIESRFLFLIDSNELPRSMFELVKALWKAIEYFKPKMRPFKPINIIINTSPFELDLSIGKLVFTTKEKVINVSLNGMVFLDFNKMLKYPFEIQIACIVEEFVHSIMGIADEDLTSYVVAYLCPEIGLIDGKYAVVEA